MKSNFDFILTTTAGLVGPAGGRILDFGCGKGEVVTQGLARGLDIDGADTFDPPFGDQRDLLPPNVGARLHRIVDGKLPFADASFDLVISNQVFEHIPAPEASFAEIARVLRPGGQFFALFPTIETWYEGHIKLYFVHWMDGRPRLQRRYASAMMRLGLGRRDIAASLDEAVDHCVNFVRGSCHYHRALDMENGLARVFGSPPARMAGRQLGFRLGVPEGGAGRLAAPVLDAVARRRLGQVYLVTKTIA